MENWSIIAENWANSSHVVVVGPPSPYLGEVPPYMVDGGENLVEIARFSTIFIPNPPPYMAIKCCFRRF